MTKFMFATTLESKLCPTHTQTLEEAEEYFRIAEMSTAYKRGEITLPVL
jgi:hypothetical protein